MLHHSDINCSPNHKKKTVAEILNFVKCICFVRCLVGIEPEWFMCNEAFYQHVKWMTFLYRNNCFACILLCYQKFMWVILVGKTFAEIHSHRHHDA